MIYGSICSGIEAATVAWHQLGWRPAFFAEIDKFPSDVLKHHYPEVPNAGDFTKIESGQYESINLLVGGTPCQSFSVAGLRKGLDDERGNLCLEFCRLADRIRPQWLVWENVPGVLSSRLGRDFGCFLGAMGKLGYGFAYRILDAQYFGVPQRRRRVFVVGYLGDWRPAAAVLFERHSLSGNPPPSRKAREQVAGTIGSRAKAGGGLGTDFECDVGLTVAHSLRAEHDASEDGTGRGTPIVPVAFGWQNSQSQGDSSSEEVTPILDKSKTPAVAFNLRGREGGAMPEEADAASLRASSGGSSRSYIATSCVRRLTPMECERLQGFPDDYTLIPFRGKPAADGPRYKAIGNSMAVPVMRWIGQRIQMVSEIKKERK